MARSVGGAHLGSSSGPRSTDLLSQRRASIDAVATMPLRQSPTTSLGSDGDLEELRVLLLFRDGLTGCH
jgi:hypothetical protein